MGAKGADSNIIDGAKLAWEQGSMDATGATTVTDYAIRTLAYVPVSGEDLTYTGPIKDDNNAAYYLYIYEYASDYTFIQRVLALSNATGNPNYTVRLPSSCAYVKLVFGRSSASGVPLVPSQCGIVTVSKTAQSAYTLIDTSATSTAFYVRKSTSEKTIMGARTQGNIRTYRDTKTSKTDVFSAAAWTSGLNSTNYYSPWTDSLSTTARCKFSGASLADPSDAVTVNLINAYAYWKETGRIMFAGANCPYYGYMYIDGRLAKTGWSG